jgi:hypothetical protein
MRLCLAATCVWVLGACSTTGSATAPAPCSGFRSAEGPYATLQATFTAIPPAVQLAADRDVILLGETPSVMVYADAPNPTGGYYDTSEFTVTNPDGNVNDGPCDAGREPHGSRGFAALNFKCHAFTQVGVYTIRFEPARSGIPGDPVELSLRVVDTAPKTPSAQPGWQTVGLTSSSPQLDCYAYGESYVAALDQGALAMGAAQEKARLPAPLASRMSEDHARTVKYVFEADDGWIVMFDHGEFGGGIEWFARAGGAPRSIFVGTQQQDEITPQNINRAMAADGAIYVLQGIAHMGINEGQLAKIWREHDHFTSHVIARYPSEPVDWIRRGDGSWLIATWSAIWQTLDGAPSAVVANLPKIMSYPTSLVSTADGTLFVGTRGGVIRLTPTWPDVPRYATDFLWKPGSTRRDCHAVANPTE